MPVVGWTLRPEIDSRLKPEFKRASKICGSAFTGEGVPEVLAEHEVETVSTVGYMTNNCDIATAVHAEARGYSAEVLSDASGAIHLANEAGSVSAETLHTSLMVLLNSNFAAVATTDTLIQAARSGAALPKSDLGTSAMQGRPVRLLTRCPPNFNSRTRRSDLRSLPEIVLGRSATGAADPSGTAETDGISRSESSGPPLPRRDAPSGRTRARKD